MAPDFERLARMPWPIASLASSGIKPFNSVLDRSCSRNACRVFPKQTRKLRPGIGCAHVNNPDGLNPRPRRFNSEEARGLATLNLQMGGWRGS